MKRVMKRLTFWQEGSTYLTFLVKYSEWQLDPSNYSVKFDAQEYSANRWYFF